LYVRRKATQGGKTSTAKQGGKKGIVRCGGEETSGEGGREVLSKGENVFYQKRKTGRDLVKKKKKKDQQSHEEEGSGASKKNRGESFLFFVWGRVRDQLTKGNSRKERP